MGYKIPIIQHYKNMTPEEKARVLIDQMFTDAGWKVVSRDEYSANLSAAAIEEGILEGGMFCLSTGKP